jgi:hypothetical protein
MTQAPPFWSRDFHLRFLPGVIRRRLRGEPQPTGFASHGTLYFTLAVFACLALIAIGLPGSVGPDPSWVARAALLVGVLGLGRAIVASLAAARQSPPTYDAFLVDVFAFCIILGGTIGLWGAVFGAHAPARSWPTALATAAGLVAGYLVGIPAGLGFQRLGQIGTILRVLAWPAVIGLLVTAMVLLSG